MAANIVVGILRALLTADTAQFDAGLRNASASLQKFGREASNVGRQASNLGQSFSLLVTLPLVAAGTAVAKVAIDFESAFAGVRKTTQATKEQFKEIELGLRNLAKQIPVNVNELARLAEVAGALGIPTDKVVEFTEVMAKLGVTTNLTAEQAATSIAKIQNVFGAAGKDVGRFGAALVALGVDGASAEDEILELANRMATMGRSIGLSQAQILGYAAAIANIGIEAEAGGSAVSRTFNDISQAVSMGGKDLETFARVAGRSAQDFVKLFRMDSNAGVMAFIEGLSQVATAGDDLTLKLRETQAAGGDVDAVLNEWANSGSDLAMVLKELGIIEVRQMNAVRGLALAYHSPQGLSAAMRTAIQGWQQESALNKAAAERFATTASELTKLASRIKDVGITIGEALLPMIKDAIHLFDQLLPLLEGFGVWFKDSPVFIQRGAVAFGLLLAAAGPMLFTFGQLAFAASQLAIAFGKKGIAVKAASTILGRAVTPAALLNGMLITLTGTIWAAVAAWAAYKGAQGQALANRRNIDAGVMVGGEGLPIPIATAESEHLAKLREEEKQQLQDLYFHLSRKAIAEQRAREEQKAAADVSKARANTMVMELNTARQLLTQLTAAQKAEIAAGIESGKTNNDIAEIFNTQGHAVKITELAIAQYRDQLQKAGTDARKAARDFAELTGAQERQEAVILAGLLDAGKLDLAKMTEDSQREVAKTLGDGIKSWLALGEAIPANVEKAMNAVVQMRVIPDVLKQIKEGLDDLTKSRVDEFFDRAREEAEQNADALLKIWNDTTAVINDNRVKAKEIEFRRAEHTIEMAKQAGAHWKDTYAMERQLHRARVDAAIVEENRRFEEETRLIKQGTFITNRSYEARLNEHRLNVQAMEEDFLLSEQAKWDALRRTKDIWFMVYNDIKSRSLQFADEITSNLGTIFFGLGHDIDGSLRKAADEAKVQFERVKKAGKSSAETIANAFDRWREAEDRANFTFLERMKEVWMSFKKLVIDILNDVLGHFVRNFIAGMVRAIAGAKLGEKLGGIIMDSAVGLAGGGGGGGGAAGLARMAGSALPGLVGGGGAAAFTTMIPGTGIPTVTGAGGTGLLAPGAAGGGGAGLGFLSNPGFWTNPWTIGVGLGALLTWGILKKGWLRGGEEGVQVNPRRNRFLGQFAGFDPFRDAKNPPGFYGLAKRLTELTGKEGGGPLFQALLRADKVKEYEAAQQAIVSLMHSKGMRGVKSYMFGGFVPPGAIIPAVLHGGIAGEDIVPRHPRSSTDPPTPRAITINHNIMIEGVLDRENVAAIYRDIILPLEKRALELNQGDILSTHRRVLVP